MGLMWRSLGVFVVLGLSAATATPCDTPVFRYAMSNWAPAPYHVLYVYEGQPAAQDQAANQRLKEWTEGTADTPPANLLFRSIDRSDAQQLEPLPDIVREACTAIAAEELPRHLVFTAWGAPLGAERLDEAAIEAIFHSPARDRIATLLDEGKTAVLLVIPGVDAAENDRVGKAVATLVDEARAGRVTPERLIEAAAGPAEAGAAEIGEGPRLELGVVRIDRQEPAEQWLIRSLTALEPDLNEYVAQPMVYFVFGRGQVMPPYVGAGISAENLRAEVGFVCGPCSCTVKQENPGGDLPMQWDWDSTARKLDELDLLAQNGSAETEPMPLETEARSQQAPADTSAGAPAPAAAPTLTGEKPAGETRAAATAPARHAAPARGSFGKRLGLVIGGGMALAVLCVFLAGLALMRRQPQ